MGMFSGIGPYMEYGAIAESGNKLLQTGVSATGTGSTTAATGDKSGAASMPTDPATLKGDLEKLDTHLPKADPGKPYTTEDVANALRDPKTGEPAHIDGKPVSGQDLQALTALSNQPDKRPEFFAAYQKQYDAALAAKDAQGKQQVVAAASKAISDLTRTVSQGMVGVNKLKRERHDIDQILPKAEKRIADRPMNGGRNLS